MAASSTLTGVVTFDAFHLDLQSGELRRNGVRIKIQPQPAKVLALLVSRAGEIVSRAELAQGVWGSETFVDFENGLNYAIRQVRNALEDNAEQPRFLETVPKLGYRFIAPVQRLPSSSAAPVPAQESGFRRLWPVSVVLSVVLIILAALTYQIRSGHSRPLATPEKIRLVVLPFQNLTGQPDQEFLSDGFTEEMITQLGGLEHDHLSVIARTSSMSYKNSNKPVSQIGRELDVQYVVEGSIRSWGARVRVTAQLIHAEDQSHIWAQNYESDRKDILRVQSEIAEAISEQIRLSLSQEERSRLKDANAVDPQVYELCLLGRYEWNKRTEDGLAKIIGYFREAIGHDSGYAPAYAGLAEADVVSAFYGRGSPQDLYGKAQAAAERAVQLDKLNFQAHATLGLVASSYLRPGAGAEFQQALQINPNYATAHHWYAFDLWRTGQRDRSLSEMDRALELDPVSPIIGTDKAMFLLSAGQVDDAVSVLKRTLDLAPQFSEAHRSLAIAYANQGRLPDAASEAAKALELNPNNVGAQATVAYVDAISGHVDKSRAVLEKLSNAGEGGSQPWYFEAWIYVGLNQQDKALECLEKEYQARTPMMIAITIEPIFRPLISNPRFQKLLQDIQKGG